MKRTFPSIIFIMFVAVLLMASPLQTVFAQENQASDAEGLAQERAQELAQENAELLGIVKDLSAQLDVPWAQLHYQYYADWYDHRRNLMKVLEAEYAWQKGATDDIHTMVTWMVWIAVALSAIQVAFGILYHRKTDSTEVEISADKVKMVTTVTGFVMMLLTFAFFYIYVTEVYNMEPSEDDRSKQVSTFSQDAATN